MPAPCLSPVRGLLAGVLLVLVATSTGLTAPPPWDFKDGDRVVFVGDTFIEREQRYGYLETALTLANPDKRITFRNLGWSADTVRGLSRAGFDPPEAGFRELVKHVTDARPTVLVVGYGMAESFDGEAGLPRFVEGYNAFLDAVAPLGARLVLLSPLPHAKMPAPLPDPTAHNHDLRLYADAIRSIAESRGAAFVDVLTPMARLYGSTEPAGRVALTDNGIHLTGPGYRALAALLVGDGAEGEGVEELRRTILAKNELFFHRWRPQNITYLFGFRKHEQGRNAVEVPQFDPLVEAKEAEIDALREAVAHEKDMNRKPEAAR